MVKHLCCYEVYHQPSPSQWVVGPWHMLLGIKPDRNHGYWTQKNYCGGVFDPSLCVCVFELSVNCMESAEAFCEGNKSPTECVSVAITLIAERGSKTTTYISFSSPSFSPSFKFSILFSLTNCFFFLFFPPLLEFKTGRSEESVAGCVLYEYLSGAYSIKGRLINRLG